MKVIGKRVPRIEDRALLTGGATFVDDIRLPDTLHAAFVRSPHAHARVGAIDTTHAGAQPGVHAVYMLADIRPHLTSDRLPLGFPSNVLPDDVTPWVLSNTEVCHVGETVAVVLADSRYAAEDAAALVDVDYDPLPAVSDCVDAAKDGAPRARGDSASNAIVTFAQDYGDCDAVFADAKHVFRDAFRQHRGGAHPIEGRGAIARYDAVEDRLTLWTSTQMAHEVRQGLIKLLAIDEHQLRIVAPSVGGGFGSKYLMYPEEVVLSVAAKMTGRPVKWTEDRREHFVSSLQERDQVWDLEIATDELGRVLGLRGTMIQDQGAYTPQGINLPYNASTAVPGPYKIPAYHLDVTIAETNKIYSMPVRGAGYPEGTYAMERMLDRAAQGLGLDRAEIRRRNLIRADEMPYETPLKTRAGSAVTPDSGDFHGCLDRALDEIDAQGIDARKQAARQKGLHLGLGIACGIKGTGRGPFESGIVRIERSGRISVFTGAMAMGQGLDTMLAQVAADAFDVPVDDIRVISGDTGSIALGLGGFASRQTVTAGSSVHLAAGEVRDKALKLAAHMLEAAPEDVEFRDGRIGVKGTDRTLEIRDVAEIASGAPGYSLPDGIEAGLEASVNFKPPALTYSFAVHAVETLVDPASGETSIARYVVVSDCGTRINPMIVDGQVAGGVVHGIGNALFEWAGYDEAAQPVTTNFAEYLMPTATELRDIEMHYMDSPSPLNPLGVKGVGECGTVPAAAAVLSSVEDALREFDVTFSDYPLTPQAVCAAIKP